MQTRPRSPSPAPAAPRRRSAERRGSVLLMVMGVLALLAIVAVLYAAIGQGDRRTSAALQREVRIETQARAIADYIAGIIADDAVTTVSIQDPRDPTNPDARIRSTEQFDYPSVDGSARSMSPNAAAGETLFTPAGRGTDPWLASHEPGWAALFDPATADPPPYGTPLYTTFVDWPQISNIAPNGWFVNRANLRNNFHAAPGTGTGPGTAPQTSSGLSLMTAANGAATVQTNAAALNTPALFTRNQRYAYRPAGAPNASGTPYYAPGDYRHISNQWADADGDGMLDARWTELVRWAPGPTNSTADDEYIPVIPAQGPARLLVAARIVDCSAMVNVNTATDYALTPGLAGTPPVHLPSGLTPAEVDLARLLAMSDWYDIYGGVYDEYNNAAANTAANYTNYDRDTALEAGRAGATWLRHALLGREPNDPALVYPDNNGAAPSLNPMPHAVAATPQMGKASYYLARAAAERFAMTGTEVGIARGFGLQDELELRARHGCNDASRYSALERVLGGKHTDASLDNFDPMRSNRGPEVEHAGKGWPPVGTDPSGAALPRDILAGLANPRSLLTTHSGARPLRTRLLDPSEPDDVGLGPLDVRLSAEEALRAATDPTNPSLQALYRGVADALLPYARIEASGESAWDTASATHASTRTLFYGHRGPELAARCAAHLVANLIDSFDRDDPADIEAVGEEPTRLMVLLRDGLTATTSQAFASVTDPRVLDLTAAHGNGELYLAQPGDTLLGPDAIEVIGIEAQPVVVQAAMFHIYTDTPENAGGDSDGDYDDINGNGIFDPGVDQPAASRRVSIRGDVDATNPDFLGQVLAIQVTNPFRWDASLGEFYVQYADYVYDFPTGLTLPAGDTLTFYALNPGDAAALEARWQAVEPTITPGSVERWLETQLDIPAGEVPQRKLERFDLAALAPVPATDVVDLLGDTGLPVGSAEDRRRVVLLWRRAGDVAARDDDILSDRLRDPAPVGTATLDRRLDLPSIDGNADPDDVEGTQAGPETPSGSEGDNTGFSITMWGAIIRRNDPMGADPTTIPIGAMPLYCVETKTQGATPLNRDYDEGADPDALDRSHFTGGANYSATTLIAMLTGQQGNALITELAAEPKTWVSSGTETIPQNQAGRNYEEMYPEIHLNNGRFEVELNQANNNAADRFFGMRPADVLLALAVGPSFAPPTLGNPYPAHADVTALDEQWTTLPEALALATDFEPVPPPPAGTIQPIYFDLASANPRHAPAVFDRGHLRTDRYVPFFDGSTGTIDPELNNGDPEFDAAGGDVTLPPGVPMAAAVVDAFRTLPIGSLTQVIPGQVNICTAPGSVLRLLPGLAPDAYGPYPLPSGTEGWTTQGGTVLQRTAGGPLTTGRMFEPSTQVYDVAAAIQAYRDKAIIMARARNKMIDFRDTSAGANDGRFERSRVSGIREETGLVMPSEILGVHIRDAFSPTNPDGYSDVSGTSDLDNSIGRFGWAGSGGIATTNRTPGLDSFVYRGATGNLRPDEITDDYDEQLTIANLVLGSVSTRSDVFCVYFLVHGYLPSDVEGLEDRDPLVPSIARRYLMVVDRSNVLGAGDKPRILLFQELPL